ncbi:hypothetical protein RO3G_09120 [Rhizopus delemar RA 99-880]|uniref:Uncharacterized protein n=1 Tax=Rhizopus delemar (strain RA 99-880 / ATCC MYA-4621 / FGSC 9543 / NRRL 43880) TaxID=246409 RepID=I1C7I0_RHIO9|nr:hypothetical protein RO3G_09120 [Rhizopus delemar RA 99-880]|eukprot:EIE84410.1 hypothetical protein RO3G_09120 [Rhizopus delemar RA 99-880]
MTNQFEFDKVTATKYLGKTEDEKHIFSGYANAEWCIGDVPHGGKGYENQIEKEN